MNGTQYDDEYVIAITDWYHDEHSVLIKQFLSEYNPTGAEPVPNSGLIYFYHWNDLINGFNQNATIQFVAGIRYRLRIINMSSFAMWHIWIEDHTMQIIEVDGVDVQKQDTEVTALISIIS